jgi:centromere protein C
VHGSSVCHGISWPNRNKRVCLFPATSLLPSSVMPTSARKSSLSNLRRGPKAHIPYRGDNPEVGKKTGIAVQHVERKSDGFEPFDELIQAADGLTPPQRKYRRKSLAAGRRQDDDDDEFGEQSMQIDSELWHSLKLVR